jgi:hypothetical protein
MSNNKTQPTAVNPADFIAASDPKRRDDSLVLLQMMEEITGEPAVMWGPTMVGFGKYHYHYDSGRQGDAMRCGFSPRKANLTIYFMAGFAVQADLLPRLGKHKTSVSCLYVNKLADVNLGILREMLVRNLQEMARLYPPT